MLISSVGLMARVKLKDVQVRSSQTGALPCFHAPRSRLIYGGYGGVVAHNWDRDDVVHGADTKRFTRQPHPSLKWCLRVSVTLDGLGGAAKPCAFHKALLRSHRNVEEVLRQPHCCWLAVVKGRGHFASQCHAVVLQITQRKTLTSTLSG